MVGWLEEKSGSVRPRAGSALVLVIVITVLLATVGVMFVMMSRLGQVATSAIADNRELSAAVDVVVNRIHTILVDDLFGGDDRMFNGPGDSASLALGDEDEYYDYPGPDDPWLANLEPVEFPLNSGNYYWPHISDIYQIMGIYGWYAPAGIVGTTDPNYADADGDGVTDSLWVRLPVTSSKGKSIFAAVRIIDNCAMININTAYRDPTSISTPPLDWDGSLLTHINLDTDRNVHDLEDLAYYGFLSFTDSDNLLSTYNLHLERCGGVPVSDLFYHNDVARCLLNPAFGYVPFDIGDELEFRNRFFLFSPALTRSGTVWPVTFNPGPSNVGKQIPYAPDEDIADWFAKATSPEKPIPPPDPPQPQNRICNRRHITTTYSFDRTVRPYDDTPLPGDMADTSGQRKFGIQLPTVITDEYISQLAGAIYRGLPGDSEIADRFGLGCTREGLAWQFAVNLIDYQDDDGVAGGDDDEPTYYALDDGSGLEFWGVENVECIKHDTIFISEVAYVNFNNGPENPPLDWPYFAIELFNPDTQAKQPWSTQDYYIVIDGGPPISLDDALTPQFSLTLPSNSEAVVLTNADLGDVPLIFPNLVMAGRIFEVTGLSFAQGNEIVIYKQDWPPGSGADMPVDRIEVPQSVVDPDGLIHAAARNQTLGPTTDNLLWPGVDMAWMWADSSGVSNTLGSPPNSVESDPNMRVQLAVTNESLRTIGEIENVLAVGYNDPNLKETGDISHTLIGDIEQSYNQLGPVFELGQYRMGRHGRINLADPNYRPLLDFLTCFDPSNDDVDNNGDGWVDEPTELAVAGRININTAPWFVIKHLPWLGLNTDGTDTDNLAQAIVAWRDGLELTSLGGPDYWSNTRSDVTGLTEISEEPGFRSIAELLQVINEDMTLPDFDIRKYLDINTAAAPDYTPDMTDDDFEERDIIFQRISNLVTVRSDVFTAYILVRIGHDGPQKRMIAIFDRSNVFSPDVKPRLVALHPVPDPR